MKSRSIQSYVLSLLVVALFILPTQSTSGQAPLTDHVVGQSISIQSQALAEDREVLIYLPEGYYSAEQDYPVLYLLDGQRFYLYAVSLLQSFTQFNLTPPFIIVGVKNKYPDRFRHFTGGAKAFSAYLEEEVVALIDERFRTSTERLFFAWEYGGSFGLQTMIDRPALFDAFFLASPFPIDRSVDRLDSLSSHGFSRSARIHFTVGDNEGMVAAGTQKLNDFLSADQQVIERWSFQQLPGEEHRSTPYSTLYHGLRKYYQFYPELQVNELNDFLQLGGMDYAYSYNQQRFDQFGLNPELTDWTKFTIIRSAIRADDYQIFSEFYEQLASPPFLAALRGNRPYSIASFFETHGQYDEAIRIYEILVEAKPDTSRPLLALADVYEALNDRAKADRYKELAEALDEN